MFFLSVIKGDNLAHQMLITVLFKFQNECKKLVTRLGPKPNQAPSGVWNGNLPILLQDFIPLGHSAESGDLNVLDTNKKWH